MTIRRADTQAHLLKRQAVARTKEEFNMTRVTPKSIFVMAAFATVAAFAPVGSAQAGGSPFSECRKWVDTGVDMRCFDCYKLVGSGGNERWVNVCSTYEPNRRGSGSD
jgi:hypothetical protein